MEILYLMLPTAVLLGAAFVGAFLWASRRGQFDDLETPAIRILFDDAPKKPGEDEKKG
ncbi:MAG: cbb3-type cytochrome oxidase assembly protein CcoS [Myxococcota bacterium]